MEDIFELIDSMADDPRNHIVQEQVEINGVSYTRSDLIPKWHKWPDEKPTKGGDYLVCTDILNIEIRYFENDKFSIYGVIGWMELPEPYKED